MQDPDNEVAPWTSSDESEWVDPLIDRFGDHPYVRAARDSSQVSHLISDGIQVNAEGLFAAIEALNVDAVEALLNAGAGPNTRSEKATKVTTTTNHLYANQDFTPVFWDDWQEWYPIQFAAHAALGGGESADKRTAIIALLLDRGADIYHTLRQPFRRPDPYPFPGEEDIDWSGLGTEPDDIWTNVDFESPEPPVFGPRSVAHSIIEDGGCAQAVFNHPEAYVNLEHRDPLGRTLLHSVCRSGVGADSSLTGTIEDCYWDTECGWLLRDPFSSSPEDFTSPSLFHHLRLQGANLFAVDTKGKSIVHHLFEAQDPYHRLRRPPIIKNALEFVLAHCPALINQPDNYGNYSLHAALQRRLHYPLQNSFVDMASLDTEIDRLLTAGADPLVRDARGNTALHYLAAEGIAETLHGDRTRALAQTFLNAGVDVNTRNRAGRSAMDLVLDDDGERSLIRASDYLRESRQARSERDVDREVLNMFHRAGVKWNEGDGQGRGLMHFVAMHLTKRAAARAGLLCEMGCSWSQENREGKTALEIAKEKGNDGVVAVLEEKMFNFG